MTPGNDPTARHDPAPAAATAGQGGTRDDRAAWAASGAMFLTGRAAGPPLDAPGGFVERLRAVGEILSRSAAELGRSSVEVDVLGLLGERAALAGLRRAGDVSCGGSARLLPTADGWLAVNLPRPDDLDLLPAWLAGQGFEPDNDVWASVAGALAKGEAQPLAERAQLLGLPVAALPHGPLAVPLAAAPLAGLPVVATPVGGIGASGSEQPVGTGGLRDVGSGGRLEGLLVADLSSLWAGPLCTHLLQQVGARVVKVESRYRPDGARRGPAAFFDLLHGGQEAVAVDFGHEDGRAAIRRLLGAADVVVEGSRPRALEQLGIVAEKVLAESAAGGGPRVWVSITGYGRAAPGRDRVAFGDDAAAAGGLVVWDETGPCFCADAVADPCAGIVAAAATLRALTAGGRWLLDISMHDVAAHLAGPWSPSGAMRTPAGLVVEPPRARAASGTGPGLGEHTKAVLADIERRWAAPFGPP